MSGYDFELFRKKPDFVIPGVTTHSSQGKLNIKKEENPIKLAHLGVEIICQLGNLEIKRIFRIYPGYPPIACDYYISGEASDTWAKEATSP